MASVPKKTQQSARQFLQLCLRDGAVDPERVRGVLAHLEAHPPAQPVALLKALRRLLVQELAKGEAVVEHAGAISPAALELLAAGLSRRYGRPVTVSARPNPALLAGLRLRIADDVYESSVASQLAALAAAV